MGDAMPPLVRLLTAARFSFAHAQFVWDCKSEPSVRDIFAKIWGTDKLTVSFGMDPCAASSQTSLTAHRRRYIGRTYAKRSQPRQGAVAACKVYPIDRSVTQLTCPQSDQSAYRPWAHCIQGLLNLVRVFR